MRPPTDWLPGTRAGILAMAGNWVFLTAQNLAAWGVPESALAALTALKTDAEAAFAAASGAGRTVDAVQTARDAQRALAAGMRLFRARYFHVPPLTWAQWALLGFKMPGNRHTRLPAPLDFAGVRIIKWAPHEVVMKCAMQTDMNGNKDSNYLVRVKYAPVKPGGSGTPYAAEAGGVFVLSAPPRTVNDLPNMAESTGARLTLVFPEETSGMTCFFAAQYVSRSRKAGPLGEMMYTVIP